MKSIAIIFLSVLFSSSVSAQSFLEKLLDVNTSTNNTNENASASTSGKIGSFTDTRDGQTYQTITFQLKDKNGNTINKTWMLDNLNYKYKDSGFKEAKTPGTGSYYSWEAAMRSCPDGWHLPTTEEWEMLMLQYSSADLRAKSFNGTNKSGLEIEACGWYNVSSKKYQNEGALSTFWSRSSPRLNQFTYVLIDANMPKPQLSEIDNSTFYKTVRCVKNNPADNYNTTSRESYMKKVMGSNYRNPNKVYVLKASDVDFKNGVILKYHNKVQTNIVIPDKIHGVLVTQIGRGAFQDGKLKSVKLPTHLKHIQYGAFYNNTLKKVEFNRELESIGRSAFYNNNISILKIPSKVKYILFGAFSNNKIEKLVLPKSVIFVGRSAFNNNKIRWMNGSVSNGLIYARKLNGEDDKTTVVSYGGASKDINFIPSTVHTIYRVAFQEVKLESCVLPKSVSAIGFRAFHHTDVNSKLVLPDCSHPGFKNWTSYSWGGKNGNIRTKAEQHNAGDLLFSNYKEFLATGIRNVANFEIVYPDGISREQTKYTNVKFIVDDKIIYLDSGLYADSYALSGKHNYSAEAILNGETYKASGTFTLSDKNLYIKVNLKK